MNVRNKYLVGVVSATLVGGAALWEGVSYTPYKDIGGVVTVCHGYTGIIENRAYTPQECTTLLKRELDKHGKGVLACITQPLKQHEYDAFTLMAYNVGVTAFCQSTTVKHFNAGNVYEACNAIAYTPAGKPNWSYVQGKFVQGLHNRRMYERSICLGGTAKYRS